MARDLLTDRPTCSRKGRLRSVEPYTDSDAERLNTRPVGLVAPATDTAAGRQTGPRTVAAITLACFVAIGCGDDEMNPLAPSPIGAADAGLAPMGDGGGAAPSGAAPGGIANPAAPSMTGPLGGGRMSALGTGTTCEAPATGAHWNAIRGKPMTGGVGAIRTRVKATFEGNDTLTRAGVCEMAKANVQAGTFGDAGPWCGARGHTADWEAAYAELDRLETCRATPPEPTVNNTPTVSNWPATLNLETGAAAHTITLSAHFSDADSDALTYTVSATGSAATAAISSGTLTITPVQVGTSTVTVTASDGDASVAGKTTVTVTAPAQPQQESDLTGTGLQTLTDCSDVHIDLRVFGGTLYCDVNEGDSIEIKLTGARGSIGHSIGYGLPGVGFSTAFARCHETAWLRGRYEDNAVAYRARVPVAAGVTRDAWYRSTSMDRCGGGGGHPEIYIRFAENDTVTVDIGHRGDPSERQAVYVRHEVFWGNPPGPSIGTPCWFVPYDGSLRAIQRSLTRQTGPEWFQGEIRHSQSRQLYCDTFSEPQFNEPGWRLGFPASFHPVHNAVVPWHRCTPFGGSIRICPGGWLDGQFVSRLEDGGLSNSAGPARIRMSNPHEGPRFLYRWRRKGTGGSWATASRWTPRDRGDWTTWQELFPCTGHTYEIVSPEVHPGRHFVSIEGGPPKPWGSFELIDYSC